MPRDITITFEDGSSHVYKNAPDDVTPDAVSARASQEFGKAVTALDGGREPSFVDEVVRKGKVAGSALVRGALGIPALAAEALGFAQRAETPNPVNIFLPPDRDAKAGDALRSVAGIGTQPETGGEKWLASAAEGVGGSWLGGGTGLVKPMLVGAASGLGAEAGGRLSGDNPLGRLAGGIFGGAAGGGVIGLASRVRPQSADLAREAMEGIDESMLLAAQKLQASASKQGVQMDLAQALEAVGAPASNLTTLRNVLANSRYGSGVQQVGRQQPGQLEMLADTTVANLPGPVVSPGNAANMVQQAATGAITSAKKEGSALWRDTLKSVTQTLRATEDAKVLAASDLTKQAQAEVGRLRGQLTQLQNALATAKAGDEAAVASLNAKADEAAALVERLKAFALPRGQVAGNTGRMLDLPARGQSIDFDQIARETQAGRLEAAIPPKVAPAPSLQTLQAEQAVVGGQRAVASAEEAARLAAIQQSRAGARRAAVDAVPAASVMRAARLLDAEIAKVPNTGKAQLLTSLRNSLFDSEGNPIQDATALNEILKSQGATLRDVNLATKGVDAGDVKWTQAMIAKVRGSFGAASKPFQEANKAFARYSEEVVDPLKQSVVGRMATRRGALPDVEASVARIEGVFKAGSDSQVSATSRDIPKLFNELQKVDPEAVPAAAKAFLRTRLDQAFGSLPGETVSGAISSPNAAKALQQSLFANRAQWQGIRDMTAGMARSYGVPEADLVRGMENFMQITRGLASRPDKYGGLNWGDVAKAGGKSQIADVARVYGFMPFERVARRIEDATLAKTFTEFDRVLTTPEGAQLLLKLSKTPTMSNAAIAALATFGATSGAVAPDNLSQ